MASKPWRLVLSLTFGLLSLSACKDVEDLPEIDPVDDPWVAAIENEEPTAEVPAPAEAAVAVNDGAAMPAPVPVDPDPSAAAVVDPAVAEAAKLAGASVPSSTAKAGGTTKPSTPSADPGAAAVDPAEPAPATEPAAAVDPAPAIDPAPAPAPAKPAAPPPITMADFNGKYRFTGGSSQEQAVADAIEFGANQVVAIARGIARKRLTKTQIIEDPITLTVTGDDLKIEWGTSGDSMTCVIDGSSTTMSYKGDNYKGRARSKDGKLITSFQAPDATKTVVYVLSSDRKTLTVHHKLVADQLQEPVTFKLTYTRK